MKIKQIIFVIGIMFVYLTLQNCSVKYSFTGINLDPKDKTVTIKYFRNRAALINPTLSQNLTEGLKDRFMSQTSLELVDFNGDLTFEGEITGYKTSPVSISANQTALYNRLTVTVKVKYTSINKPKSSFESTFSRYADFESTKIITDVEDELTEQILEELIDDIFNKSVVNW